ncbi:MAG: cell division protein SepF [Peptococcaceae bacterium]|nr:cell division protein SepF [Peptococcaceae bacterium]
MGILDNFMVALGFADRVEDDVEEEVKEEKNVVPMPKQEPKASLSSRAAGNVVSFNHPKETGRSVSVGGENARVVLVEPQKFDEAQGIADSLLSHKAVVINIESCNADIAAKLIDFIGGVVYAIDGSIQKVSQGIVLAAPANIDIASELKHNIETNGDEEIFAWVTRYNHRGDF